jgi:uncharacterized protein (TIGR03663 family)
LSRERVLQVSFLLILVLGATLRVPNLKARPMHTDEAVHAIKFGALLEEGNYRYDPVEYHGPTLNYLTLIPAWLESSSTLVQVDETTLRIVPVVFGLATIALLALLIDGLGWLSVAAAALLTSISPAMVFFSRYYVQEMLLVCFTVAFIAAGYRWLRGRHLAWALAAGAALGLMHATKETAIISLGAIGAGLLLSLLSAGGDAASLRREFARRDVIHLGVGLGFAAVVSAALFSSFLSNPAGVLDSYRTYGVYLSRAVDQGHHVQPWNYYLELLLYFRGPDGPVWTEAMIVALAGAGLLAVCLGRGTESADPRLLRFLAWYTLVLLLVQSAIPYKTPWNLLSFWHGLILLAGIGTVAIVGALPRGVWRKALVVVLAIGCAHLTWQSWQSSHRYHSDPGNPYVYSHPTADIFRITRRVEQIAAVHPAGLDLRIDVVKPDSSYWPLPWYLRAYPNVGWWQQLSMQTPAPPVILATPELEGEVLEWLYQRPPPGQRSLYVPLFDTYVELRPNVELRGYVAKDLWDRLEQEAAGGGVDEDGAAPAAQGAGS